MMNTDKIVIIYQYYYLLLIKNSSITFVTKSGFRELLMHSVRQISFHLEISGVFMYTTHIGSDFENTSQSNKFLKNKTYIYELDTIYRICNYFIIKQ